MLNKINKKIKPTSLKYLYEFAAIPIVVRHKYLEKLLTCPVTNKKRKNSEKRKNVRLLKIIYSHIEENKMIDWDEDYICAEVKISKDMLYCHKHWLLTSIRSFYFNWKETEKKEFGNLSKGNEIFFLLKKALRMEELGMSKEAKNIFLKIEKIINSYLKKKVEHKLLLLDVYKHLYEFYHYTGEINKFRLNIKKSIALSKQLLKHVKIAKDKYFHSKVLISLYVALASKPAFKIKNIKSINEIQMNLYIALKEALSISDVNEQINILSKICRYHMLSNNYKDAKKFINEGCLLTQKYKLIPENILFKVMLLEFHMKTKEINEAECTKKLAYYYESLKQCRDDSIIVNKILHTCAAVSSMLPEKIFIKYSMKYVTSSIISYGYNFAFQWIYLVKLGYYDTKLKTFNYRSDAQKDSYIVMSSINETYHRRLQNTLIELLSSFNRVRSTFFIEQIYLHMLSNEFWKGRNLNSANTHHVIDQLERLYKTRKGILHNREYYNTIKFLIQLIEGCNYMSRKKLLDKYERQFSTEVNKLFTGEFKNKVFAYSFLSYTAEQLGYKELKDIMKESYFKLEEKYPGIFDDIKKDIEAHNSGVLTHLSNIDLI